MAKKPTNSWIPPRSPELIPSTSSIKIAFRIRFFSKERGLHSQPIQKQNIIEVLSLRVSRTNDMFRLSLALSWMSSNPACRQHTSTQVVFPIPGGPEISTARLLSLDRFVSDVEATPMKKRVKGTTAGMVCIPL